ncbi:ABC-2 type transport system ATP-binding protein [Nocardioides cavernae]|uniref:ABC-2 type transport system ATP-binding protein n=1 Tax=Nocardioides cavernae TaxID=1921566 RepID=A0A7Y9KQ41_9ACTN|nr:ABC transporter ATP-binding protein [Nocardioides cavernae]NYE35200.1 ABC-2 type transport system ATP-binding protein [Nocardioides cavernae]
MISISHLRKAHGSKIAVDDVSFEVAEGEVLGVLGPNGAGKTTTVECVAGLRVPDAGTVRVAGLDPLVDRDALTRLLGVQLQESRLQPKITVGEALRLWSALYDDPVPWGGLLERLDLVDKADTTFRDLSGGQQQRLSIALALIGRPRAVILDELSTGLDPRARREVWQIVRDLRADGVTVLLVTHSMEEAQQLCDRIAIIDAGRVRALDTPDALIAGAAAATVTSFTADDAVDLEALRAMPSVSAVRADNGRIVVEGRDGAALAVLEGLRRQNVVPAALRVVDGTLDTAYLQLTGPSTPEESRA